MFVNYQGGVAGDVSRYFFLSFLVYETAKPTNVDIMAVRHIVFHNTEKSFYRCRYIGFVNSGFLSDFVYYVCFGHVLKCLKSKWEAKVNLWPQN